jgi:tRNA (5-methylaminomethyl-2-thiouridylate)-methyltransferase
MLRIPVDVQQLINLRLFTSPGPRHVKSIPAAPAPPCRRPLACRNANLDVLQTAKQLSISLPPEVVVPLDAAPPFEEWPRRPELLAGCEPGSAPLDVALLLSGGVDSTLAMYLLHAAGHRVTAYYLQIWFQEDFRNFWDSCPWEEDLEYCRAACDRLGVSLKVVPLSAQYWDRVVAHCIAEVRAGRTPNPDVLCNSRVKFGAFLEHLESEKEAGNKWDRVASGHYARMDRGRLALTPDAVKDQTYFLAHLAPSQLERTLFPLGALTKTQVRALAAAAALPNQDRKDSQGICFLGKVRFSEFIKEHLGEWPGPIIKEESDEVLGYHRGFWFHTVGQRKGVHLSGGPWYVTRKDPRGNAVYVSRQYYDGDAPGRRGAFRCEGFSWTGEGRPDVGRPLHVKVRHGPHLYACTLEMEGDGRGGRVTLDGVDQGLAAGQYAVFYQDGACLGCAMICED